MLSIVKTGDTSQHADILFLHWHSQRDGVLDESNDRSCTGAGRAGQKVCKSTSKRDIFTESLHFIWSLEIAVEQWKKEVEKRQIEDSS